MHGKNWFIAFAIECNEVLESSQSSVGSCQWIV